MMAVIDVCTGEDTLADIRAMFRNRHEDSWTPLPDEPVGLYGGWSSPERRMVTHEEIRSCIRGVRLARIFAAEEVARHHATLQKSST